MAKQYLTLVTDIKFNDEGEQVLETKDYILPSFIKGGTVKQALKLGKQLDGLTEVAKDEKGNPIFNEKGEQVFIEHVPEPQLVDKLAQFASDAFGGQFKKDEAIDGIDSRDLLETLSNVLGMVISRESEDAKKKQFIEGKTR